MILPQNVYFYDANQNLRLIVRVVAKLDEIMYNLWGLTSCNIRSVFMAFEIPPLASVFKRVASTATGCSLIGGAATFLTSKIMGQAGFNRIAPSCIYLGFH
jgi:hypothetical protein